MQFQKYNYFSESCLKVILNIHSKKQLHYRTQACLPVSIPKLEKMVMKIQ